MNFFNKTSTLGPLNTVATRLVHRLTARYVRFNRLGTQLTKLDLSHFMKHMNHRLSGCGLLTMEQDNSCVHDMSPPRERCEHRHGMLRGAWLFQNFIITNLLMADINTLGLR